MDSFNKLLAKDLEKRKSEGAFRSLKIANPSLIDFSSNDYLGLARSAELAKQIERTLANNHINKNGSTGSRLLTGNSLVIENVEKELATFFNSEATLLFNSGYTANLAVLSSLPKRGDTILYDELSHASIKDGMRLSLASRQSFKHNDLSDLEKKLQSSKGNRFVVVESVYSMDGDIAPIEALVKLCDLHDAHLIIDEAHSTGIHGKNGEGLSCQLSLDAKIPVRIYTFGKAMGIHGACIAGSKVLINYIINFARPFIYTTAVDAKNVLSISAAFNFLSEKKFLVLELERNIKHFTKSMNGIHGLLPSTSAIQSFIIPGNDKVKSAAQHLQDAGFDVRPILSPTVPQEKERLRIIIHAFNSLPEIDKLTSELRLLSSTQ